MTFALVELVRKAVGDDFHILTDGNKAPGNADAGGDDPTLWNFKRAVDTAMEYQRLNVYWFEEPLPRYDYAAVGRAQPARRHADGRRRRQLGHPRVQGHAGSGSASTS